MGFVVHKKRESLISDVHRIFNLMHCSNFAIFFSAAQTGQLRAPWGTSELFSRSWEPTYWVLQEWGSGHIPTGRTIHVLDVGGPGLKKKVRSDSDIEVLWQVSFSEASMASAMTWQNVSYTAHVEWRVAEVKTFASVEAPEVGKVNKNRSEPLFICLSPSPAQVCLLAEWPSHDGRGSKLGISPGRLEEPCSSEQTEYQQKLNYWSSFDTTCEFPLVGRLQAVCAWGTTRVICACSQLDLVSFSLQPNDAILFDCTGRGWKWMDRLGHPAQEWKTWTPDEACRSAPTLGRWQFCWHRFWLRAVT